MKEKGSNKKKFKILKLQDFQAISEAELKELRALIFVADSTTNTEIQTTKLEFCIPTILVLKTRASEDLVNAFHICLATANATIGNFSAAEALEKRLINKVAAEGTIETEAIKIAERIADKTAPIAVQAILKAVIEGEKLNLEDGLKLEAELFKQLFFTEDAREGVKAFLEKRDPNFCGK